MGTLTAGIFSFSSGLCLLMNPARRLAIVTQDPANFGGVLRLAAYIYRRSEAVGMEPTLLHYGRFEEHAELHASLANLLRGEINVRPTTKLYSFLGMRARAIGAYFPEWEPNRLAANRLWRSMLNSFNAFILVTGSAQTGLPLAECNKQFAAWVSSSVEMDRSARLAAGSFGNFIERLGLPAIRRAEQETLQAAHRLMAVSDDAAHHIQPLSGKPVDTWPYPVDTERFTTGEKARSGASLPHRFLFVGRANDPRKRLNLFLRACEAVLRTHPELTFEATIVSRELNLPMRCEFAIQHVASASEERLVELYQSSTALVMTSEQEGLGIAAMEAMACGLPVISTRCGGPEMFIDGGANGFLVKNEAMINNAELIARHMAELAEDSELRRTLGNAARETILNRFSEEVWNPRFEALLRAA